VKTFSSNSLIVNEWTPSKSANPRRRASDLAASIFELGTFMVVAFIVLVVLIAGAAGFIIRQWAKHYPPRTPKEAKPPYDMLTSTVLLIGWLGWLSAAALASRYSLGWSQVCLVATALWIFINPHMVSLLRNKSDKSA
jgi:hypothetical protein